MAAAGLLRFRNCLTLGILLFSCIIGSSIWSEEPSVWPGRFTQFDFDCGGYVTGFTAHPNGRLFCKANVGGLYRSDDHGETWQWLASGFTSDAGHLPQGVAVADDNPDLVIQAVGTSYFPSDSGRGIWKSLDGGLTWRQTLSNVNFSGNDEAMYGGSCLVFHPTNPRELWCISRGDGLWSSQDKGETWQRRDNGVLKGFVGAAVLINPEFPDQIWVCGERGIYFSANHGQNWVKVRSMGRCFRGLRLDAQTMLFSGGEQGKPALCRLTASDWGRVATWKWEDLSGQFADCWAELPCLTMLRDKKTIFCGSNMVTKISYDRGQSWHKADLKLDTSGSQPFWQRPGETFLAWGRNEIMQDPLDPQRLYMGSGFNLVISADGGKTWRNSYRGIAMTCTYKTVFHPTKPNLIVVPAMDQYALIIDDGGKSGKASLCLGATSPTPGVASGAHILMDGDFAVILYTRFGDKGARLGITHDGWATWTEESPKGIPLDAFVDGLLTPNRPNDFLVVAGDQTGPGRGGIYRTRDGGKNFSQCSGLPSGFRLGYYWSFFGYHNLYAHPNQSSTCFFWINGSGFYKSKDGGDSWQKVGTGLNGAWGQMAMDNSGQLWVLNEQGLFTSKDAGERWQRIGDIKGPAARLDAQNGWVTVFGQRPGDQWNKIYLSNDQGQSWREVTRPGYRFPTVNGLALNPHQPGQLWISTNGRSNAMFMPD